MAASARDMRTGAYLCAKTRRMRYFMNLSYKGFALRKMGWCVAVEKNLLRVTDGGQEKSLCRGGGARPRKVAGGDDAAEFVRRHFAPAYSHQCARNGSDHIAQEAVGADGEDEFRSLLPPSGICDFADVEVMVFFW